MIGNNQDLNTVSAMLFVNALDVHNSEKCIAKCAIGRPTGKPAASMKFLTGKVHSDEFSNTTWKASQIKKQPDPQSLNIQLCRPIS
jgi:hypothetical protein